mmetsp:Transcript_44929/g.43506  ORF Transcript_44929/g.43506 Transcript_44929/m.43506 type:complete len:96 (+) Transcript_44929:1239-1526(+)|eukprot:CAMPEP_0170542932 /NCGR_PEP_ID=MMETSP0211-20121228/2212_1 /TAXON_ID=311385 /ORGANISM="Pseudokeronopsis sp., Strain OXSARD2" /LENGTH=95 /DNA_ID=CAMNT_0010846163 /DNA_START=1173 /DNA_END=1460 /DNA_ORIENTATION=-
MNDTCTVQVMAHSSNEWKLGLPFFKSFSVTFDRDKHRIAFGGDVTTKMKLWAFIMIFIAGVALLALIGLGIGYLTCVCYNDYGCCMSDEEARRRR